jgi:ribonuclease HII
MSSQPYPLICGVDEAGRGPLAGPVFAACVILDPSRPLRGLADSKQLAPERREELALRIRERALAFAVASASVEEIDTMNILQATLTAMRRAVESLDVAPAQVVVDGNRCPELQFPTRAVVRGDAKVRVISAASILAKTARDAFMLELHAARPEYGFDRHKGYPTPQHLEALRLHGVSQFHRRSFAPVREFLVQPSLF